MSINLGILIRLIQKMYLRIMKDKLIDMFSTPSIIKKIVNANCKSYVYNKLKSKFEKKINTIPKQLLILSNLKD